jgi:hypothetical protein
MAITLGEWAAELEKAVAEYPKEAHNVVEKNAKAICDDWRERWRGLGDAPYLWAAVTYDATGTHAEIGPDKSLIQGALGNLLEFGSINNAPRPAGMFALEKNEPHFAKDAEDMLAKLLGDEA